MYYSTTTHR